MNKKDLLTRLSAIDFTLVELRLFLDTHKDDTDALEMFDKYNKKYKALKKQYEEQYGPLTLNGKNSDEWTCDPWPWDNSFNKE